MKSLFFSKFVRGLSIAAILMLAVAQSAVGITVQNFSFESPDLAAEAGQPGGVWGDTAEHTRNMNTLPTNPLLAPGWICTDSGPGGGSNWGVADPSNAFYGNVRPAGPPAPFHGKQFGFINVFGTRGTDFGEAVSVPIGTLQAGHILTLQVAVGVRNNAAWSADYFIGLELLDGTDLGTFTTTAITAGAAGVIQDMTYTLNISAQAAAFIGQQYRIVIRGTSAGQLNFDNVRLTDPTDPLETVVGKPSLSTEVNVPTSTTLMVFNNGASATTLNSLTLSNGAPWSFTPAPTFPMVLAANQRTTFTLRFAPTVKGAYATTATLSSTTGAANNTARIAFTGTGFVYEPTFIRGVTATAFTQVNTARVPSKTVDHSGIAEVDFVVGSKDATASSFGGDDFWLSTNTATETQWIEYDLGQVRAIGEIRIWNCNDEDQRLRTPTPGTNDFSERGMKLTIVQYKSNAGDPLSNFNTVTIPKSTGALGAPVSLVLPTPGLTARYVRLQAGGVLGIGNYRGTGSTAPTENSVGIGEVRFYTAGPNAAQAWTLFE